MAEKSSPPLMLGPVIEGLNFDPTKRAMILTISGFNTPADHWSGMAKLSAKLIQRYASADIDIQHRVWSDNFDRRAAIMRQWARKSTRIIVIGHSFGCGRGVVRLAQALAHHGMSIDLLCLVDAVIRPGSKLPADKLIGKLFAFTALMGMGYYKVPANVHQVAIWRQTNKRGFTDPIGFPVRLASEHTQIIEETVFFNSEHIGWSFNHGGPTRIPDSSVNHSTIDDDVRVHNSILQLISERI